MRDGLTAPQDAAGPLRCAALCIALPGGLDSLRAKATIGANLNLLLAISHLQATSRGIPPMKVTTPLVSAAAGISPAKADAWEDRIELLSQRHFLDGIANWQSVNIIPLVLIGICSLSLPDWRLTAVLIGLNTLCLAAMFCVSRVLAQSENPPAERGWWQAYDGLALCSGALWAGLMLPVVTTLGTDINSTFVCVIIIASVAVTSMVIATRRAGFVHFLAGVMLCLLPQTIFHMDLIGPIPLIATLALGPALWGMAAAVYRQDRSLIRAQLEKEHLTQELSRALEKAEFLANRDSLTGLYNRRAFEGMARALKRAPPSDPICLILIDLDHFKSINDRFGHATGDNVLQNSARLIVESMRPSDVLGRGDGAVARWGGEEFLLLLPNCALPLAVQIAERLRGKLADLTDPSWPKELAVSGSFGVACWAPEAELHQCISDADQAMYRAKQAGRNRVEVWQGSHPATTSQSRIASAG